MLKVKNVKKSEKKLGFNLLIVKNVVHLQTQSNKMFNIK